MSPHRLLVLVLLSLLPFAAQAAAPAPADRIIVKWKGAGSTAAPASPERVRGLAARVGQNLIRGRSIGGGMSVVELPAAQQGSALAATLRALNADPDIEFAEPDRWVRIQAYVPNDPLFSAGLTYGDATHPAQFYERQWYLGSGQISSIRADLAWEITKGGDSPATSPVVIAVIDTGVRMDHPDLDGKLLPGFDFVSSPPVANDGDGWDADPSDPGDFVTALDVVTPPFVGKGCNSSSSSWHGTRVAGLIGANTDNSVGIAGSAFNVRLVPVRALGKCGGSTADVIAAMYWAAGLPVPPPLLQSTSLPVNANPAQVINMSLGSEEVCSAAYATAVNDVTAHGVLIVASAGNEGTAVGSPASCAGALAVAGLRHAGTKVGYSSLGPEVGIGAPAGNCVFVLDNEPCVFALHTTTNAGTQAPAANGYSTPFFHATFGTSFSSPLVAGTAGLMKAVNPSLTPALLIARVKESARAFPTTSVDASPQPPACVLPSASPLQAAECICNTQVCGAGMLDAHGAVLAAQRPAVFASATGVASAGRLLTLDGSRSAPATGRTIASYLWSVESTSGGAQTPTIGTPTHAVATVMSPNAGSYVVKLTVTDNFGSSDSALITVKASGGTSSSPPPAHGGDADDHGGGGTTTPLTLLLLATGLLLSRRRVMHVSRN